MPKKKKKSKKIKLKKTKKVKLVSFKPEKIDYNSYAPLKEAIEAYLMTSVKDLARVVTKSKTRDDDQQQKYSDMVTTMMDEYGYSPESAEEVLNYASNNLWRDS